MLFDYFNYFSHEITKWFAVLPPGVCDCLSGYIGDDCRQGDRDAPQDVTLRDLGMCDVHVSECTSVVIYGDGFTPSSNLTCQVLDPQVRRFISNTVKC